MAKEKGLMRLKWVGCILGILVLQNYAYANSEAASEQDPSTRSDVNNFWHQSSVIPKGSVSFATSFIISNGNRGYSRSGGRENFGFDAEQISQDFSLKIGVWDGIHLFVSVPYVFRNLMSLDGQAFRSSSMYRERMDGLTARAAESLAASGVCSSTGSCQKLIAARYAPIVDVSMALPNGENLLLRPGVPVLDALDAVVLGRVAPEQGLSGIGDVEFGFGVEILRLKPHTAATGPTMGAPAAEESSIPLGLSVSPRLRLPTARFEDVPASKRPVGLGTTMASVTIALGIGLERHTLLGLAYEVETEVAPGKRRPSSWTDGKTLREQKSQKYSRTGVGQRATARLEYALAGLGDWMEGLVAETSYDYEGITGASLGGVAILRASSIQSLGFGLSYRSNLIDVPFSTGLMYTLPVYGAGEDILVAPSQIAIKAETNVRF
jgi:hypothetical protein